MLHSLNFLLLFVDLFCTECTQTASVKSRKPTELHTDTRIHVTLFLLLNKVKLHAFSPLINHLRCLSFLVHCLGIQDKVFIASQTTTDSLIPFRVITVSIILGENFLGVNPLVDR